jgi:hypothetical protein
MKCHQATKWAWWDQFVLGRCQYRIKWLDWLPKPPVGACWCLKQHEMPPKWYDGTNWCSDGANIISHGQLCCWNHLWVLVCSFKSMTCHQIGLMGPIGAQMVPISHQMASLFAETTCGCLLVSETAWNATKVAWWDQLVLRWCQYHITWLDWLLKPPVVAGWSQKQHVMPPKWDDGTNWCSDGANITSDGQFGCWNHLWVIVSGNKIPLKWHDGTNWCSDGANIISHGQFGCWNHLRVLVGAWNSMKCHQSGMMGPIGAQMVPISHLTARLIAETTCGCLLVSILEGPSCKLFRMQYFWTLQLFEALLPYQLCWRTWKLC